MQHPSFFADLSWLVFFASSHNQNTSQGCKPESFLKNFLFSFWITIFFCMTTKPPSYVTLPLYVKQVNPRKED